MYTVHCKYRCKSLHSIWYFNKRLPACPHILNMIDLLGTDSVELKSIYNKVTLISFSVYLRETQNFYGGRNKVDCSLTTEKKPS